MTSWVLSFRREQALDIAKLRELGPRRVRLGEIGELVWARSEGSVEDARRLLALAPAAEIYELLDGDRLRPIDRLVPTKRLPAVSWSPLETELETRLPRASLGGSAISDRSSDEDNGGMDGHRHAVSAGVDLRLVPSEILDGGDRGDGGEEILLGSLRELAAFADSAPEHRLERLRFALDDAGEVLVRGAPLPSMPGERFVLRGGVAAPRGLSWRPAVAPGVVRAWLGLDVGNDADGRGDVIVLIRRDHSLSEIRDDAFAPLGRSLLRELERPSR